MKLISCEKLEKSMVELQFSIDAETFKSAVNTAFKREGHPRLPQGQGSQGHDREDVWQGPVPV